MAITTVKGVPTAGVIYTQTTDTSADFVSVANSTYFYNLADKIVRYKDATGTVLEIFSTAAMGTLKSIATSALTRPS